MRNASFTDYLIPTALDMPEVGRRAIEEPEPGAPFGAKGVGEPPTISSTPAVAAAIRAATGLDRLTCRMPGRATVLTSRPDDAHGRRCVSYRVRLLARLDALAEIGADRGRRRSCRLALTDDDRQGRDLVVAWMRDLGLASPSTRSATSSAPWPAPTRRPRR